ncbi:hypothetical protein RM863_34190 [Streptomyces sp. DSM 41014]|uniref:Transposase n=1 Tax=Streptomyces hintoniae TaxID=3075521 RepID=A0ABU2UV68_9ACTN|nr:hypothetical protein [Streptomyces sp. DSM 41014]MDT0477183.1 hypothetical protein [Streptomyces sp. DSM 41014]
MTAIQYFWRHPLAEQVREEGREEGRLEKCRELVIDILKWRGLPVTDSVRERVSRCADLVQLETWGQRAVRVSDTEELFADE